MTGFVRRSRCRFAWSVLLVSSAMALSACQTKTASLDSADQLKTASTGEASFTQTKALGDKWQKDQGNVDLGLAYAANLEKLGQNDQAMTVLQTVAVRHPEDGKLQGQLGKKMLARGQTAEAIALLDRAVANGSADWKILSALGSAYDQQGKNAEARSYYARALASNPNEVSIMNNMGMSYALEGNLKEAEKTLRLANATPGANTMPKVRQNLALVVGLQGRFDESRQIASADLPPEQVEANLAYLQKMLSQPNTWQQLSDQPQG